MWKVASKFVAAAFGWKDHVVKPNQASLDCLKEEPLVQSAPENRLECPVCWESFNIIENVPYVLWCGHTLCKCCVVGLQRAALKFPSLCIQLPFFVSCPWCRLLSLRLVCDGDIKCPSKNYFLLWMVESMNTDRSKTRSSSCMDRWHRPVSGSPHSEQSESSCDEGHGVTVYFSSARLQQSVRRSLALFFLVTAKFPLAMVSLLIVAYAVPASTAILALYIFATLVLAVPSVLMLYFAFPSLDWLVRQIVN